MGFNIPMSPKRRKRVLRTYGLDGMTRRTVTDIMKEVNHNITNTRLIDTDWDEFFGDLVVKEEPTLEEIIMKRFSNSSSEYNGMELNRPETVGTMISNAIKDYDEFKKKEQKKIESTPNWCEIRY